MPTTCSETLDRFLEPRRSFSVGAFSTGKAYLNASAIQRSAATSAWIVLQVGMLMRNPQERPPEEPRNGKRASDSYLLALVVVLLVVAVLMALYALFLT